MPVATTITLLPFKLLLADQPGTRRFRGEFEEVDDVQRLLESRHRSAYVRLGQIGTPASIAALRLFEERARNDARNPAPGRVNQLRTSASASDGTVYTMALGSDLDQSGLYLSIRRPDARQPANPRPMPVPLSPRGDPRQWRLRVAGPDRLVLTIPADSAGPLGRERPVDYDVSIAEVTRDSDGDGVTDLVERRMGLDPANPDTDGDGHLDAVDPWPDLPGPAGGEPSEDEKILQRAVFAADGPVGGEALLIAHPSVRPVRLLGHYGPVLYSAATFEAAKADRRPALFVAWRIVCRAGSDAVTVAVSATAPGAHHRFIHASWIDLVKREGEWNVIRVQGLGF
jgi:hypothetical protein